MKKILVRSLGVTALSFTALAPVNAGAAQAATYPEAYAVFVQVRSDMSWPDPPPDPKGYYMSILDPWMGSQPSPYQGVPGTGHTNSFTYYIALEQGGIDNITATLKYDPDREYKNDEWYYLTPKLYSRIEIKK